MAISVENQELRTTREVVRELNSIIDLVKKGDVEKIVITKNGKMEVGVISLEELESYLAYKKQKSAFLPE